MIKKSIYSFLFIAVISAQNPVDVLRPFWGFNNSQILSNSIGGATVASGYITPGLTSNPANLAAMRFSYMQLNFSNSEFSSATSNMSNSGFNGIDFVQPIPVYRGSLVLSAGAHKSIDFMSTSSDNTYEYSEKGKLTSYHLGAAVEFAKRLYLGADIKLLRGNDEMVEHGQEVTHYYKPEFSGSALTLGLMHVITKNLQYGISFDMPRKVSIEDYYTESNHINEDESSSESDIWYYDAKKPMTVHLGGAMITRVLNLFYELEYTDWTNLEFSSDTYGLQDILDINNEIKDEFGATLIHHIGGAMRLPIIPAHLFAGYQYLPTPFKDSYNNLRESYSLGFSVAIKKNFTLQGSYDTYFWEFNGSPESYDKFSIGVSLHNIPGL
tara:strand:- start:252 stop:1397 length:1146 start_codon:yes stop_codon:yes gene_type:complete